MYFKVFNFIFYMGIASLTYLNVYFKSIGLSSSQIGAINSVAKGVSFVVLPLWGMAADYFKLNKRLLMVAVIGAMLFSLSFLLTENYLVVALLVSGFFTFMNPIVPLADAQLLGYLGDKGNHYGKYRVWGSLGYTLMVPVIGYFIERTLPGNLFYLMGTVFLVALFLIRKLPQTDAQLEVASFSSFKLLLRRKKLLMFSLFSLFINLTLSTYHIYFPLYMIDHGAGETLIGIGLMLAAGSEMVIFHFSELIIARYQPKYIFLVSALTFTLRWVLLASFPVPMVMIATQLLHSLTFGLFHVTAVNFVNLICGAKFKATGQNLYAMTKGVSGILAGFIGGIIYEELGGGVLYLYLGLVTLIVGIVYFMVLSRQTKTVDIAD